MSQENLEIVRRGYDRFNRRDLASATDTFHPDAEWIPYLAALEEEKYRGPDQILAMWREVLRDLPDLRIELEEVVRDQGDVLVVAVSFQGMGRASGADIRATVFQAISFRDGQVTRIQGFQDRDEALEAVGLRE